MNDIQNQAVSCNDEYWSDLVRLNTIEAESSVLYTTKFSFERGEYQLHILQVSNEQLVPGDKTEFAVSGADWLEIVAKSKASQDAAQDRVALANGDEASRYAESMAPWFCSDKKQVYLRSTCYMDKETIVLELGQRECFLCGADVVRFYKRVRPKSADGRTRFRKVREDECRPALGFESLFERRADGGIDTDDPQVPTRKGQQMDIIRATHNSSSTQCDPPSPNTTENMKKGRQAAGKSTFAGSDDLLRPDIHYTSWVTYAILPKRQKPDWELIFISASDQKGNEDIEAGIHVVKGFQWEAIAIAYRESEKDRGRLAKHPLSKVGVIGRQEPWACFGKRIEYLRFTVRLPGNKFGIFPESSGCLICGSDLLAKKWCRSTLDEDPQGGERVALLDLA